MEDNNLSPKKKGHPFLMFILIVLAAIGVFAIVFACTNNSNSVGSSGESSSGSGGSKTPQLFTRDARNSDITIDLKNDFSLSMNYTFVANVDIKGLELTFTFTDSNHKTLTTVKKSIGNVVKGNQYEVTVSLTEFSLWDIFKISYSSCAVTGGTVSYFA